MRDLYFDDIENKTYSDKMIPYMHSKDTEHRVYVRAGARKAEADYLQLSSLLEKRKRTESQAVIPAAELFGSDSQLHIPRPVHSNQVSPNVFKFILSPRNIGAGLRWISCQSRKR
jgi:hypothetical protein